MYIVGLSPMLKTLLCCGIPVALKRASENVIIFRGSFYVVRLMNYEIGDHAFIHKTPLHKRPCKFDILQANLFYTVMCSLHKIKGQFLDCAKSLGMVKYWLYRRDKYV